MARHHRVWPATRASTESPGGADDRQTGCRKQSANITDGKVVGDTFALTTGPIDGYKVGGTGRHLGDAIEFTIEGVKQPLTLTRMK